MRIREERGSSTMLLLAVWGVLMAFLACSFDLALYYVYREQMRTALEAATAAGAMQARYWVTLELHGHWYEWKEECVVQDPSLPCVVEATWLPPVAVQRAGPAGWEEEVWTPLRQQTVEQAFPALCTPTPLVPPNGGFVCEEAVVVDCRVTELSPGIAAAKARQIFEANRARWAGRLANEVVGGPYVSQPTQRDFRVDMSMQAQVPTRFLKMFGWSYLKVRVDSVGSRLVRLTPAPPGCK